MSLNGKESTCSDETSVTKSSDPSGPHPVYCQHETPTRTPESRTGAQSATELTVFKEERSLRHYCTTTSHKQHKKTRTTVIDATTAKRKEQLKLLQRSIDKIMKTHSEFVE